MLRSQSQKYFVVVVTRTILSSCLSKKQSLEMSPTFVLEEYVSNGSKIELTTLPKIYRSWRHDKRCTAILFDKTLVMAVYVPDSDKDLEQYEGHISFVLRILREGQRGGPKFF